MNIGGWHIFGGLFFLVCCMAITLFYVYLIYVVLVALKQSKSFFTGEVTDPAVNVYWNKRFISKAGLIVFLLLSVVYTQQRIKWMGNDNAHYKAKEYYVAGQVVFAHRKIMGYIFHPENIMMRPYTVLQKIIYHCGIKYLPPDDGERFVWQNDWFLYLYTWKIIRPYGVDSKKYEPSMVKLLDRCWESMEGMATRDIKDFQMKRDYYLGFPALVAYYTLYQGHYTGKFMNSGFIQRKTEYLIEKHYKILFWLDQLSVSWEQTGLIREIKSKYPFVAACRQGTILDLLQDLSLTIVSRGEFTCDHPLIKRMYTEYVNAMSDDPDKNYFLLYSKTNSKQAKALYHPSVYGGGGDAANYLLSHICGKKMPTEKYNVVSRRDPLSCDFFKYDDVEEVFDEELKPLLKEKYHE